MNKDLAGVSAVWRALFGVRQRRFSPFLTAYLSTYRLLVKEPAEDGFAADDASVSGDGHSSRCCTLGEFSHHCDCVSVIALQEKCDEKGLGAGSGHCSLRCRQFGWGPPSAQGSLSRKAREGQFALVELVCGGFICSS